MKILLGLIIVISGIALLIGVAYYLEALRSVTTADDYRMGIGAGIIAMSLLPFIISIGFYKVVDMLEDDFEHRKIWLEAMNKNLIEIRKRIDIEKKEAHRG